MNTYICQIKTLTEMIENIQRNRGEDVSPIFELAETTPWLCLSDGPAEADDVAPEIRDEERQNRVALRQLAAAARSLATMIEEAIDRELTRELDCVAEMAANQPAPFDPYRGNTP
jgi:hypothetical protein